MSKTIENLKSGNYEVVDNQGVSVTTHFIECLEKELANFIEPKFKIGQEVWFIDPENDVSSGEVCKIEINCVQTRYTVFWGNDYEDIYFEYELFATKEEAKAKLEELKNG